jgi:arylsulfatase A-like enzyme
VYRAGAFLLIAVLAGCSEPDPHPRNLLLVTVDTLRADHLSSYGNDRRTSPSIDRLAGSGVRFHNAFVQRSGTWPSLTSIFTSRYPRSHGVRSNGDMLAASVRTFTQQLRKNGFHTAAMITNMLRGRHPGFDELIIFGEVDQGRRDEAATARTIQWLREHGDEKFFVWLHLMGPHDPYEPAPEYRERYDTGYRGPLDGSHDPLHAIHTERLQLTAGELGHVVSLYDAEIAEVDARIGRVLAALDELGLTDDTLVAFTSDHGEELYGRYSYFFHSWSIYDSVLKVPLILSAPRQLPRDTTVDTVVESIDLAPTVLEVLGIPVPSSYEGRSLVPLIAGDEETSANPGAAFAELGPYIQSIRTDRWHYVYNPRELSSPGSRHNDAGRRGVFDIAREELYDVREDPAQLHNVADRHPEVVAELRDRLLRWRGSTVNPYRAQELDPAVRKELEMLGYLH